MNQHTAYQRFFTARSRSILFDCGANRVFEDAKYHYVFRTAAHTGIDGIGAARYVLGLKPGVKTVIE